MDSYHNFIIAPLGAGKDRDGRIEIMPFGLPGRLFVYVCENILF
jgi:hypothetical protein